MREETFPASRLVWRQSNFSHYPSKRIRLFLELNYSPSEDDKKTAFVEGLVAKHFGKAKQERVP